MGENCIVEKIRKKKGQIFRGHFHGNAKVPGFFWEKYWGFISGPIYRDHTVPVIRTVDSRSRGFERGAK